MCVCVQFHSNHHYNFFFIEVSLAYNVSLVLAVQHNDSTSLYYSPNDHHTCSGLSPTVLLQYSWLYSLWCTFYPCGLFIPKLETYISHSTLPILLMSHPLPSDNHPFVLGIYGSVSDFYFLDSTYNWNLTIFVSLIYFT